MQKAYVRVSLSRCLQQRSGLCRHATCPLGHSTKFLLLLGMAWLTCCTAGQYAHQTTNKQHPKMSSVEESQHWAGKNREVPCKARRCHSHIYTQKGSPSSWPYPARLRVSVSVSKRATILENSCAWVRKAAVRNVTLGWEFSTSAAVGFSKHESFFSKLFVTGCGTTC